MFILSCTTIYSFVKNFFLNIYISVNMVFKYSYLFFFWLRNIPSIKYLRNWMNGGRVIQICTGAKRGKRVSCLMYIYTITVCLFTFFAYGDLFYFLKPYLHSKRGCLPEMDQFLRSWNKLFFTLNYFSKRKLAKALLILIE